MRYFRGFFSFADHNMGSALTDFGLYSIFSDNLVDQQLPIFPISTSSLQYNVAVSDQIMYLYSVGMPKVSDPVRS